MRKRQSPLDLNNNDPIDFVDLGFDIPYVHTPLLDEDEEDWSFGNKPHRTSQMFNSPIGKDFMSDLVTPLGGIPSLGFTPWTQKQIVLNHLEMTSTKTQQNHHRALNFEKQQESSKNYLNPQNPGSLFKKIEDHNSKRQHTISINLMQTRTKQIDSHKSIEKGQYKYRGLKNLASRVKQVAIKLNSATSKEIAETLIKQLQQEKQISSNAKDHQNIRRRVYDALKVLVSSNVLLKDNQKKLIVRPEATKSTSLQATRAALKEKLALVKKGIQEKTQKAIVMNNKFVVGQQLIQHNKNNPSPQSQRIYLPFLGLQTSQTNLRYIETNKAENSASIGLNKQKIRLLGDIDLILELRIFQEKSKTVELNSTLETNATDLYGESEEA